MSNPIRRKHILLILFLVFIALTVFRAPNLLVAPRFWAEEGVVCYRFAYSHGFIEMLGFLNPRCGYMSFTSNFAAAVAAHITQPEYAPFVTTYISFIAQSIPFLIILFGKSRVYKGIGKKIFACLIILFAPSTTGEVWLNSINLMIYFGLITVLILLENLEDVSRMRRWAYRLLLAIGGMSGPYTLIMQPIFMFQAFIERKKERYIQLAIVTSTLIIQGSMTFYTFFFTEAFNLKRGTNLGLHTIGDVSLHHIGVPFLGPELADKLSASLGSIGPYIFLILFLAALPMILFWRTKDGFNVRDSRVILMLALLILAIVVPLTSLNGDAGDRYGVLSGWVILLIILDSIHLRQDPYIVVPDLVSCALTLILLTSLTIGLFNYRNSKCFDYDGRYPNNWKAGVEKWRQDPSYKIQICPPRPQWVLKLKPRSK